VGLARTSYVDYPEIRPSGYLRRNGKLCGKSKVERKRILIKNNVCWGVAACQVSAVLSLGA